ncbi:Mucin-like protein [Trichoplax sp. H2]|nr:Mucin-like protein [Trichoplax sp. H2]|eukprot:RDD35971.1 Mucin-like protein [Trichoplax sp. H2]
MTPSSSSTYSSTSTYTTPSSSTSYTSTSLYSTSSSTYTTPSSSSPYSSTSTYTTPSSSTSYTSTSLYSTSSSTYTALSSSSTHSSTSTYITSSSFTSSYSTSSSTFTTPRSSSTYATSSSYSTFSSTDTAPSQQLFSSTYVTPSPSISSSASTPPSSSSSQRQTSSTYVAPSSSYQQSSTIHSATSSLLPSSSVSSSSSFTSQTFSTSTSPTISTTQQSATTVTATPTNQTATTGTSPNVATTPPPSRLYPYGSSQGDSSFGNRFIIRRRLYLKSPIYFANKFYQTLYICSSGYVTFHFSHCYYYPSSFRYYNIPLVAPFFSGNDMRHYNITKSRVYYREYSNFDSSTSSQSILSRATTDVDQFQSQLKLHSNWTSSQLKAKFGLYHHTVKNFNAKHVVVITWTDMVPYPASYYGRFGFTNTFQLVLVSNGENTFALYNYEVNGMQWWRRFYGLRARVGYITGSTNIHHEIALSGYRNILKIDSLLGNTGMTGKWAFRLDPDTFHINYVQKCLSWYYQQNHISYYNRYMPSPCPCTWWQVWFDRRFNWWGSVARYPCAQSRFSSPTQGGGNTRVS